MPDESSSTAATHCHVVDEKTSWAPRPRRHPDLHDGTAHVWLADLDELADGDLTVLSHDELERARRLLDPRARTRWTHARRLLRELVGEYLSMPPASVRFQTGAHGKPALDHPAPRHGAAGSEPPVLAFNLSHSDALALYAFTTHGQVGVDVQLPRSRLDELAVARRVFGEHEGDRLAELEPRARKAAFLKAWARYEATLKWRGAGFATTGGEGPAPWLGGLDPGRGGAAALALDHAPRALCCWAVGS